MKKTVSRRSLSKMPPNVYPEIGVRVKETRLKADLTQEEFARELSTTTETIKQIETGRVTPNIYILRQIRNKFKVSYNYLIDGAEKSVPHSVPLNIKTRTGGGFRKKIVDP